MQAKQKALIWEKKNSHRQRPERVSCNAFYAYFYVHVTVTVLSSLRKALRYIYEVFHKPFLQVVDDRRLGYLLYKHHVFNADLLLPLMTLHIDHTQSTQNCTAYRLRLTAWTSLGRYLSFSSSFVAYNSAQRI